MTTTADIKVGDEVRLFAYSTRDSRDIPEGGCRGTVTNAARKYATATFPGFAEVSFDMQTGREHGGYGRYYVRTPEQVEAEARKDAALALLKEAGFEVRLGKHPSAALIEALAAVVETFGQEG